MSWLSGSLGVVIPDGAIKFDLAGVLTLGLNALHLGYDALKAGVIAGLTKKNVKDSATVVSRLETGALAGFTLLQTIRSKGLAGAWDTLTQQVGDSLGAALEGAKAAVLQWVEQRVVQGVIAQLVTLCTPVGDIVELLMIVYKAVQFFLDKMRALGQFMATLKAAVTRVATGDVWHAGAQVYNAVAASVPLLLGFIADLLGLGDVSKPVRTALAALTAPLRRIEAKLVALIVSKGQALAATLHGSGKGAAPGASPKPGQGTGTPILQQQLDQVMAAALHALAKYSGKRERASDLQPTLDNVKQSKPYNAYKIQTLKPVPQGEHWAIYCKINPDETKPTNILVDQDTTAGDRDHPFDLVWPKPPSVQYPTLYFGGKSRTTKKQSDLKRLVGQKDETGNTIRSYEPHTGGTLPGSPEVLGISTEYRTALGTPVGPLSTEGTPKGRTLNKVLNRYGFSPAEEGLDADHVHEIQFGGRDLLTNLWPLDFNVNQNSGRTLKNASVTYPSGRVIKISELKKSCGQRDYHFKIIAFRY